MEAISGDQFLTPGRLGAYLETLQVVARAGNEWFGSEGEQVVLWPILVALAIHLAGGVAALVSGLVQDPSAPASAI